MRPFLDQRVVSQGRQRPGRCQKDYGHEGPYDTACFHGQQAVEKYLKGVLAWKGLEIPRTHDLEELQRLCIQLEPWAELASCGLTDLTAYAVELRYDAEFWPPQPTAVEAVKLGEQVRASVLAHMPSETRP